MYTDLKHNSSKNKSPNTSDNTKTNLSPTITTIFYQKLFSVVLGTDYLNTTICDLKLPCDC